MTRSLRSVAIGAVLAVVATPFLALTAATAAPGQAVLVFANASVSDAGVGDEIDQTVAGLEASGATVTRFDGGDGSAAAWTAALADIDVLAFPEKEGSDVYYEVGGKPWISDEAVVVIADWVVAGGDVILLGTTSSNAPALLLDAISGLDFSSVWATTNLEQGLQLVDPDSDLPAVLEYANGTYPILAVDAWPTELLDTLTPIYVTLDGHGLGVGRWTLGAGSFSYYAWDFFPWWEGEASELEGEEAAVLAAWYSTLGELLTLADPVVVAPAAAPVAAPQLAATGFDAAGAVLGGVLLLAGGALLVMRRRAVAS